MHRPAYLVHAVCVQWAITAHQSLPIPVDVPHVLRATPHQGWGRLKLVHAVCAPRATAGTPPVTPTRADVPPVCPVSSRQAAPIAPARTARRTSKQQYPPLRGANALPQDSRQVSPQCNQQGSPHGNQPPNQQDSRLASLQVPRDNLRVYRLRSLLDSLLRNQQGCQQDSPLRNRHVNPQHSPRLSLPLSLPRSPRRST